MKNNEELNKTNYLKEKEYKKVIQTLYIENQKFLANFIAIISILSFPFLYNILSAEELTKITKMLIVISLCGFGNVIFLQVIATKNTINACDDALSQDLDKNKKSVKLFEKVRKLNKYRDWNFLVSFHLTVILIINIFN